MIAAAEELLETARQRTGLSDFGPDGWQEGFEQLVAAIPEDLGDDPPAAARVEAIIVDRLVNRLRVEAWYAEHENEAAAHAVEEPLMILGTGRSGTTATHYLLAVDRQFRYPRKWELVDPIPPPDLATEHEDPRRPSPPEQGNVQHIATVDGPAEDRRIHELSFHESPAVLGVPTYAEYWRTADHTAAFPYHERILRVLHSHRPPYRWLLKSPESMHTLPPLAAHYPDMRFVMTHRDPVKVIPSACSVIAEHTRMRLPHWKPDPEFGRRTLTQLLEGVQRAMAARPVIGEERFIDIGQPELQADPVGVAERIYEFAGLRLDDSVRDAMVSWSAQNQAGSRGEHHYTAEEFGLTAAEIHSEFAAYLERFGDYCTPASRDRSSRSSPSISGRRESPSAGFE
jgi:hypothetical protein